MGNMSEKIIGIVPFLSDASPEFRKDFLETVVHRGLQAGSILMQEEDPCQFLPIVMEGSIRVYKKSPSGREITLYRIEPGQSCILTAFSILNDRIFPADAVMELAGDVILIPADAFQKWMHRHKDWREYVFKLLQERLFSTVITVSEVAFKRTDIRLMEYLLVNSVDRTLEITNQRLANELGTAREVVNRILKDLEKSGSIELSRGQIQLLDPGAIREKITKNSTPV